MNNSEKQTVIQLERANKILLVGPKTWTPDTVAGVISLYTLLNKENKEVSIVSPSEIPSQIKFLPNLEKISRKIGNEQDFVISLSTKNAKVKNIEYHTYNDRVDIVISSNSGIFDSSAIQSGKFTGNFDLIIIIGCDDLEMTGETFEKNPQLFAKNLVVNISASPSNSYFGKINLVDPTSSSICEILSKLILNNEKFASFLDKELATILLSGIIAETDSFLTPAVTTVDSFRISAELQAHGAAQTKIVEQLFKEKTYANLKVLGRMLNNLQLDSVHRMGWTTLSQPDFELVESGAQDIDHWMDQLLCYTNDADVVILFYEDENDTRIQIRGENLDPEFFAKFFDEKYITNTNGLDFLIPNSSIAEIQNKYLRKIADAQENRLNLQPNTQIIKTQLKPTVSEENIKSEILKKNTPLEVPTNIPFDIES